MGSCILTRTTRISVNTNNLVERKNKDFKHEFLTPYKDNSLSGMVTVLIGQFLPAKEKKYIITTELSLFGKLRHMPNINQHFLDKIKFIYLKTKKAILPRVVREFQSYLPLI